jgi:hypothetical protein
MIKQVEVREMEVVDVSSNRAEVRVSYTIPPQRGRGRAFGAQVFKCILRSNEEYIRLYIQGRDSKWGYWDVNRETWRPWDAARQEMYGDMVKAIAEAALKEIRRVQ